MSLQRDFSRLMFHIFLGEIILYFNRFRVAAVNGNDNHFTNQSGAEVLLTDYLLNRLTIYLFLPNFLNNFFIY